MSSHIGIGGDKVHTRMVSHPCCRDCMEQWEKLDVAKKRLALKQERLELDQALVKAEKRNLKKNSKLAAKGGPASGSGGRRSHSVDSPLLEPLSEQFPFEAGNAHPDMIPKAQHEQELQGFQEQLSNTQRSLAALYVERDNIQRERDDLKGQVKRQQQQSSTALDDWESQVMELQDKLQKMKTNHGREKREWEELLQRQQQQLESKSVESHDSASSEERIQKLQEKVQQMESEKELLQAENQHWQEIMTSSKKTTNSSDDDQQEDSSRLQELQQGNNSLKQKLVDQSRQMEDMKLQIPRNKLLMEELQRKNDSLKKELSVMETRFHEQEELVKEIQLTKEALMKQRERQVLELQTVKQEQEKALKEFQQKESKLQADKKELQEKLHTKQQDIFQLQNQPKNTLLSDNKNNSNGASGIRPLQRKHQSVVIPSDLMNGTDKKHVIEWDLHLEVLAGKYTGWMDISGMPDGTGTLRIEDGSIYDGEWKNGARHGTYSLCCRLISSWRNFADNSLLSLFYRSWCLHVY